ncbi:glycosyltransferase family 9 protein [Marinicella gelatinilytica]|uniref:glycosyltransferase family 9 protein n=1 Tax=Marinicella gelatinilytica TaxID=2996017 RepID=UPI002260DF66|nr:glycosyltransferase family 9 protein [Marinicella gelatinilytica]MCX7544963.1 glycosyltransferase family 9 protein [Marinicella gelatinilytica]
MTVSMKVLVIQMKMIGDVLVSTLVCEAIKSQWPEATVHYLVNDNTQAIVSNHPAVDRLLVFKPGDDDTFRGFYNFVRKIRKQSYDRIYDAYGKTQSNLISLFSGAKTRVSYYKWYSFWCYTQTIRRDQHAKTAAGLAIENRLRLIYRDRDWTEKVSIPKIYLHKEEQAEADQLLAAAGLRHKKLVMISALGSSQEKTLPLSSMALVIDHVVKHNAVELLFNYLPHQQQQAQELYELCQVETRQHIHRSVIGRDLRQFLALLNRCQAIIGNEGGAINMGKSLNLATFSIYAPWISPESWGIFEDGEKIQSVHLQQYQPKIYQGVKHKALKKHSARLYQQLKPVLFYSRLMHFYQANNYFQDIKK